MPPGHQGFRQETGDEAEHDPRDYRQTSPPNHCVSQGYQNKTRSSSLRARVRSPARRIGHHKVQSGLYKKGLMFEAGRMPLSKLTGIDGEKRRGESPPATRTLSLSVQSSLEALSRGKSAGTNGGRSLSRSLDSTGYGLGASLRSAGTDGVIFCRAG
jgi:hypothetical protein